MSTKKEKLKTEVVAVSKVQEETRRKMWHLFERYYADVNFESFSLDLNEKSHVLLLWNHKSNHLCGFSTVQTYRRTVQKKSFVVLYSGDTIVDPNYWGQFALQKTWLFYAIRLKIRNFWRPMYWFLITKGYKTYLLLSRNFPEYWPRHDQQTPPWQAAVIDELSREKFGLEWKADRGVVEHGQSAGRLRAGVAELDQSALAFPDIRFFAEKNPGHAQGDELCCIGKFDCRTICDGLMKTVKRRMFSSHKK